MAKKTQDEGICGGWRPTDDFLMIFDDKTAEDRTEEQMNNMVEELRAVANKYNFDIHQWGSADNYNNYVKKHL